MNTRSRTLLHEVVRAVLADKSDQPIEQEDGREVVVEAICRGVENFLECQERPVPQGDYPLLKDQK